MNDNDAVTKLINEYHDTVIKRVNNGYSNAYESTNYIRAEKIIGLLQSRISFLEGQISEMKNKGE